MLHVGQMDRPEKQKEELKRLKGADRVLIQLPNTGDSWALCSWEADKVTQEEKCVQKIETWLNNLVCWEEIAKMLFNIYF